MLKDMKMGEPRAVHTRCKNTGIRGVIDYPSICIGTRIAVTGQGGDAGRPKNEDFIQPSLKLMVSRNRSAMNANPLSISIKTAYCKTVLYGR
jgi:hypothetical protein